VEFENLVKEHKDAVYRQMIRVCGNREDAEDVLVEALLKACRRLDQLRDLVAFRSWLAQIARRVCWQLKEREALLPLLQLSSLEDQGREIAGEEPAMERQMALRQMKDLLAEALDSLPVVYRTVYEMRDLEETPGEEVARKLGISLPAMKSRLPRGRDLVRQYLDKSLTRDPGQQKSSDSVAGQCG
jgi:RNA polymerase sigma-70 factor (ECF subfamily)